MPEAGASRKLATIVALDVAGYSARTEEDEAKSTAEVAGLHTIIETIAKTHGGRIFNTAGDGFMLEFGSSLAAVEAALELAEKCEPKVRVGVHVGDVVVQPNGDLLGHGVNVAARLMAQSVPGALLVSADVRRMIRGPILDRFVSRGAIKLDKMAETIEAFALVAAASAALAPAQPKSAEPLLAVLPFDNLSNDPEMQFFSDGISEEILHTVARANGLKVIGRSSSFQFRGADKAVRRVANELRATHVLDGSVRRSGNHIRITAHLVDAVTQTTLWTDRYDRDLTDALKLQDEIATAIAEALNTRFVPSGAARPIDPVAYDLYLRARAINIRDIWEDGARSAIPMLEHAVARAPEFAQAWATLAGARVALLPKDHDAIGESAHSSATAEADRALSLDPTCADGHMALAALKPAFTKHAEKLQLTEKALALAPNNPFAASIHGAALNTVGRIKDAMVHFEYAQRLEPLSPWIVGQYAFQLRTIGHVDDAIATIEEAYRRFPDAASVWMMRWAIFWSSHRANEAEQMCGANAPLPVGMTGGDFEKLRVSAHVAQMPRPEREQAVRAMFDRTREPVLSINRCLLAAEWGHQDLAFDQLFVALDTGRPLTVTSLGRGGFPRAFLHYPFFQFTGAALRGHVRFPRLCARMGLVEYWRTSGHWPDCVEEVAPYYDFRAECEKAAAEGVKP